MKRSGLLLLVAALASGCGHFRQPPLPVGAAPSAPASTPRVDEAWAARLEKADTIYFSLTKNSAVDPQPIWQIVELLQRSGQPVALGWTEIPASDQPLLEQWERREISSAQLLGEIVRPERAPLFRQALRPDLGQVALGCPRALLTRLRDGESLSPHERALLPTGFRPLPDAFENFTDRVAASAHWRRYSLRRLYRAHLVAEQTIAENIVRFRRAHADRRLLVFLPNDAMIDPREVAELAAQKLPARQLILDRTEPLRPAAPQLLAGNRRFFEVVDDAPIALRHDRRLPYPRLRA